MNNAELIKSCVWHDLLKANFISHTFSMWLETHKDLFPKIKWLIAWIRSTTISTLNELNSLSLCLCTKIFFFRRKFLFKKHFFMNEELWIYIYIYTHTHTSEQTHLKKKKNCAQTYWLKKKKKNWTRGIIHTCLSPIQCPTHEYINSYVISFLSFVGLNNFHHFKSIFKWTY